jgi:hypothetical protein
MTDVTLPRRNPRAGVAQGSKIAVTGFGFATMLGLVALMGFANKAPASKPAVSPTVSVPAQVVVVMNPADSQPGAIVVPGASGSVVAASPSQPIVLSAQPTVQLASASQAPVAQTNGSR